MKISPGSRSLVALFILVLLLGVSSGAPSVSAPGGTHTAALNVDSDAKRGEKLVQTLGIKEMLGPLAPVALSPFFALTFLSGCSLLADSGVLPDAVAKNALIGANSPLANGFVFSGLLALTLLTTAPKLMKVTKPLAQAVDQVEAHAGIIAVVAVQFLSQIQFGEAAEAEKVTMVYQAGILTFSYSTLLAIFSAINIFVINTVKYFFEVLIFLSPVPAVDAFFEAANKAFAAFLLAVYVISPWLATVINLLIFGLCLIIFAWTYRRVVYMRSILGDPVLGWFAEKLFRRPKVTLTSTPLPGSITRNLPDAKLVLKAFAGRGYQGVARKARGYLVQSGGRLHFAAPRLLRSPKIVPLPAEGHTVRVDKGLLSNTVWLENDAGETVLKILFTRRYNPVIDQIRRQLGVALEEVPHEAAGAEGVMAAGRSLRAAVRGDSRESLQAEMA
jgi:hypothetical protein